MKNIILSLFVSLFGLFVIASEPPANFPLVKGVVKKIDMTNKEITIKHDAIPNLNMPAMTMPFLIQDIQMVNGLTVGDEVKFAADENSAGDLILIWISKSQATTPVSDSSNVLCTGIADTYPKTKIDVEIRSNKFSTIRYEFIEGSAKGTAYVNSMGRMYLKREGNSFYYQSGDGKLDTKLSFEIKNTRIENAKFYNFSAGMNFDPVQCVFEK